MTFESLFVNPRGRTARGQFAAGLAVLLAVAVFYAYLVGGRTAEWSVVVLIFPALVLLARRLHDMGQTAWLLVLPGGLMVAAAWLRLLAADSVFETPVLWAALIVSAGFAVWGLTGKSQPGSNRFGAPAAA